MTITSERPSCFGISGDLQALSVDQRDRLVQRTPKSDSATQSAASVRKLTRDVIDQVREGGDRALRELARRFDRVELASLEVPRTELTRALDRIDGSVRISLERAAGNIAAVHAAMIPAEVRVSPQPGITVGRRPDPLSRVGCYAPGGRAAYPSSLLMGAIPARVAGVGEVVVCSPPARDGVPLPIVLAAAAIANVDRVFAIGGAGAIAAMALGTESVPRVDRIVGPGNAFVAEAKLQLVNQVAIDSPAGPSELLVIADDTADAVRVAHELLAQAEHDPDAAVVAVIVGSDARTACATIAESLGRLLDATPRSTVAREALEQRGALLSCSSLDEAIAFSNDYAAEHLLLAMADESTQRRTLDRLRNVGTVFIGEGNSVAFGDYMTGANHVLPTAGLARSYSGLSTLDFVRWTTWQQVDLSAAASMAEETATFARSEGLPAHADAALYAARLQKRGVA